jgi:hypothetical protein
MVKQRTALTVGLAFCLVAFAAGVVRYVNVATAVPAASNHAGNLGVRLLGISSDPLDVEIGETLRIEFRVQNVSGQAVDVSRVDTACGCRNAEIVPTHVASGAEAIVKVLYDSTHAHPGDAAFPVTLVGTDGRRLTADRPILLHHSRSVQVEGSPVVFRDIPVQSSASDALVVTWPDGFRVCGVRAVSDSMEFTSNVSQTKALATHDGKVVQQMAITVQLTPQSSVKQVKGFLRIEVGRCDGRNLMYSVPIHAEVVGTVAVRPSSGFLGLIEKGDKKTLRFDIVSRNGASEVIVDSVRGPAWLDIEHRNYQTRGATIVDLSIASNAIDHSAREIRIQLSGHADGHSFTADVPCVVIPLPLSTNENEPRVAETRK